MRLLLDEQHDPRIAEQLRRDGYDVVAVAERRELRSLRDEALLEHAVSEGRVLVTEDARDFAIVHRRWLDGGRSHFGIALTARKRYPRTKAGRRPLLAALRALLRSHPGRSELTDLLHWL